MWKFVPDCVESIEEGSPSTEGKGWRSRGLPASASAGGGVRVCCKGEAVYD